MFSAKRQGHRRGSASNKKKPPALPKACWRYWARPAVLSQRAELFSRCRHFTFRRFAICQMLLKIGIELFFCSGVRML
jgi:hypothetical protein